MPLITSRLASGFVEGWSGLYPKRAAKSSFDLTADRYQPPVAGDRVSHATAPILPYA